MKSMKMKPYLAFDIDGTVFDVSDIAVESFRRGIEIFNMNHGVEIKVPSRDAIIDVLGTPIEDIFRKLFPETGPSHLPYLLRSCTEGFVSLIRKGGGRIFDGVSDVIGGLHDDGYVLLAASNGRREYVTAILETHGLIGYFHREMFFPGNGIPDKTALVRKYSDEIIGERPVIMIGDRTADRKAAEDNGIPFLGCAFGYGSMDELEGCRWVVTAFADIPRTLHEIEGELF